MSQLEQELKEAFPVDYFELDREVILERFMEHHDRLYDQAREDRAEHMKVLGIEDPQTIESGYPVRPVAFAEACEELYKLRGFDLRALAVCYHFDKKRLAEYEKYAELCGEFDEVAMTLREAYIHRETAYRELEKNYNSLQRRFTDLKRQFVDLFNGTRLGKWFN